MAVSSHSQLTLLGHDSEHSASCGHKKPPREVLVSRGVPQSRSPAGVQWWDTNRAAPQDLCEVCAMPYLEIMPWLQRLACTLQKFCWHFCHQHSGESTDSSVPPNSSCLWWNEGFKMFSLERCCFPPSAMVLHPAAGSPGMFLEGSPPTLSCQWTIQAQLLCPSTPRWCLQWFCDPSISGTPMAVQQDLWWQGFPSRKCISPARSNKSQSSQARRRRCQHSKWQGVHALFLVVEAKQTWSSLCLGKHILCCDVWSGKKPRFLPASWQNTKHRECHAQTVSIKLSFLSYKTALGT